MRHRSHRYVLLGLTLMTGLASSPFPTQAQKGGASPSQPGGAGQGGGSSPFFETEMLAYGAVNELSEGIAQRVCHDPTVLHNSTVIIFDQTSFQNLAMWQSVVASATLLQSAYATLLESGGAAGRPTTRAAGATGSGFIQGGADLGSLITAIAASTTNNASTFTIPDSAVAVSIMHQFQRINCNLNIIYYPLFGGYADLDLARQQVLTVMDQLNATRAGVQNIMNGTVSAAGVRTPVLATDIRAAVFTDLNTQYDVLLKLFMNTSPQNGGNSANNSNSSTIQAGGNQSGGNQNSTGSSNGFQSLLQGAEIENLINKDNTYILYADVIAAGGTQRDVKNLFTLITGDWISYSGGLVANVAVIKTKQTALVLADTLRYRTGFTGIRGFRSSRQSELVENPNSGSNEITLCNEERRHHFLSANRPSSQNCALVAESKDAFSFSPSSATGGTDAVGTIMLPRPVWRDTQITLACANDPREAALGKSDGCTQHNLTPVKIGTGSTSTQFALHTNPVVVETAIIVTATHGKESKTETILVEPPVISSITVAPSTTAVGTVLDGVVTLSGPAPRDGAVVRIASSDAAVAIASRVVFKAGEISRTFNVTALGGGGNATSIVTFKATLDLTSSGQANGALPSVSQNFSIVVYPATNK